MPSVALVNMPWNTAKQPSPALGILKQALRRHGILSDTFYLNLDLARRMNLHVYEAISDNIILGDWLFSQHLFGRHGTGELKNSYADIVSSGDQEVMSDVANEDIDLPQVIDRIIPPFLVDCVDSIPWGGYRIVAFSSVFVQQLASLLLAQRIKERFPLVKIVFGGANVEGPMGAEVLRAFPWVDYVIDGEGEESFPLLVRHVLDGDSHGLLPGVSFRRGDEVVMHPGRPPAIQADAFPIPDYSDYFRQLDRSGLETTIRPFIPFEGSRGCWWGEKSPCTYCGFTGASILFRSKPSRRILRELAFQAKRYGRLDFVATDAIMDWRYLTDLWPQLARSRAGIKIFYYHIKSNLTRRQVDLLRAAGVRCIVPGIESLSTGMLKLMRKGATALQNIQLLKWCSESGISVRWNILYGFPGETPCHLEEIQNTISSITHLMPPAHARRFIVERFSPFYVDPEGLGVRDITPWKIYSYIYPPDRARIPEIAYHFDFSLANPAGEPGLDYGRLRESVRSWWGAFRRGTSFVMRRGPGFIELVDSRPLTARVCAPPRREVLRGLPAAIYEFCDSGRPLRSIRDHVGAAEDEVREIVERFVARRLMYAEGGRYLSLAVDTDRAAQPLPEA